MYGNISSSINIFSYVLQAEGLESDSVNILASPLGYVYYPTVHKNVSSSSQLEKIFQNNFEANYQILICQSTR